MMKKYIFNILTFCIAAGVLWSCTKNDEISPVSGTDGFAYVKIAQFSPNFRQVTTGRDSFNVYVNNVKVNGPVISYGTFYPTISNLYAAVSPGVKQFRFSFNGVNTIDSSTFAYFSKTLTAGSYYSLILTDSLLTGTDSKQIFVQDNFTRTDTLHYSIRFAHTILNDTAGKNVDVYSYRLGANMFSNVSPGTVTPFASQPYNILSDTFSIRRSGTGFELYKLVPGLILARERAYTLVYKGAPTTTATKPRSLTYYINQ